jgi:hypothetical protein
MVHLIEIYVRDVERSRAFWAPFMALLGCEPPRAARWALRDGPM